MPIRPRAALAAALLAALSATPCFGQSGRVRTSAPPKPAPAPAPAPDPAPATPPRNAPVPVDVTFSVQFAGGSLAFERNEKLKLTIKDGTIAFTGKKAEIRVGAETVTEMSYGTSVRSRTAEGAGVGVLVPGLGGIIGNSKTTAHYLEVIWSGASTGGVALRVDKDDYRGLIAALEGATGLQVKMDPAPPTRDFP